MISLQLVSRPWTITQLNIPLNKPESFWNSKVHHPAMLPVNERVFEGIQVKIMEQLLQQGILYNGPYILKTLTSKSLIEYEKNQTTGIKKGKSRKGQIDLLRWF